MAAGDPTDPQPPPFAGVPSGTTELGIDIIKVDRIRATLAKFGPRFSGRVLTPAEQRYVRDRPETFAGRWAAKEAVSKVLGLGVRGIGWRDIEVVRLPTGQPRSSSTAGRRPARTSSGWAGSRSRSRTNPTMRSRSPSASARQAARYVFPPDIEDRLDDRERRILARIERLRDLADSSGAGALASDAPRPADEVVVAAGRTTMSDDVEPAGD